MSMKHGVLLIGWLIASSVAWCADDSPLVVEHFESRVTSDFPEVNVIVRNKGSEAEAVDIIFLTENSKTQDYAMWRSEVANSYEDWFTTATIPPGGWVHRVFRAGRVIPAYPGTVRYVVSYGKGFERRITGSYTATDDSRHYFSSTVELTKSEFKIEHSVEAVQEFDARLARILITNLSERHGQLYVSNKEIIGCDAKIDYLHAIKQGLDGVLVNLPPQGKGIVIVPITGIESAPECRLKLELSSLIPYSRGKIITTVSIPVTATGNYNILRFE